MRKVFIADAHLKSERDENYRTLLRFLATLEGNTDTLFILGDLFEFWIGYRRIPFSNYSPLLEQLRKLSASGVRIVYFEGNHDFHMGPYFSETLQAEVHPGPAIVSLDGKRVYLCHGDEINSRDYGYRLLRALLHSSISKLLIPLVPAAVTSFIAERMSRQSSKKHGRRRLSWDYAAILREFAAARFSEGCEVVIAGHFHLPFLERSADGGERVLLSLGDWISQFSYGEWLDGELSLKSYR
jgi:UDP-2,3-diacylglucosamine hydrolase